MHLREVVFHAIVEATASLPDDSNEKAFQASLAAALGRCDRELRASFAAPLIPPRYPPPQAIAALAARKPPRILPPDGRDPCASGAKLDILWHADGAAIPIELKYCPDWKADTNGYHFLKDLHRLERMVAAGKSRSLSMTRFAAFVTKEAVYWRGGRPEPQPFWLTDRRQIESGYWVQYDQQSPDTLWYSYPPFFLANAYGLEWADLHGPWRCLLVQVKPQSGTIDAVA